MEVSLSTVKETLINFSKQTGSFMEVSLSTVKETLINFSKTY